MTLFLAGPLCQDAKAMRSVIFFMSRRPRGSAKPVRVLQGALISRGLTTMGVSYVVLKIHPLDYPLEFIEI